MSCNNHNLTIAASGYVIHITRPQPILRFVVKIDGITVKGERLMTEFKKVGQFVEFAVEILDGKGRPAQVEGDLVVVNTNEVAGLVEFDQTTRKGKLTCVDEGVGQVTITGDANLDPGVTPIMGILDYVSNLSGAVVVKVTAGPVQDPPV